MWLLLTLLACLSWACVNVLDSALLNKVPMPEPVFVWLIAAVRLLQLAAFLYLFGEWSSWSPWLMLTGALIPPAIVLYARVMRRLDASVTCSAWAFETILLSIIGFVWLHESWTLLQTFGVLSVIGGVCFLAFYHQHLSWVRTVGLLFLLGAMVVPDSAMSGAAVKAGISVTAVYTWSLAGNVVSSLCLPLFLPSVRRYLRKESAWRQPWIIGVVAVNLCFSCAGFLLSFTAVKLSQLSLVSVVYNVQPFFIMFVSFFFLKAFPGFLPKEGFSQRSLFVKVFSFSAVCAGLLCLSL